MAFLTLCCDTNTNDAISTRIMCENTLLCLVFPLGVSHSFHIFFSFYKNRKPDSKLSPIIQTSHIAPWENECKVKNVY